MDDRKLNRLRLLIGLGIIAYFAWLLGKPANQTEALVTQTTTQAEPAPRAKSAISSCPARVEQVGVGISEVRLKITGAANTILVYTDQGNVTASTTEAGSAGEYRLRTPGPATAVQLDNCPPLNLR